MAGYQFGHISTFSFEGNVVNFSIDDVVAEAARTAGSHPHVAEPLPPTMIAGNFRPEEVPDEIRRRVAEAKAALKGLRSPDGKIQRIRKDTHVMEAQVHSHPIYTKAPPEGHEGEPRPSMENAKDRDRYLKWRSDLVEWLYSDAERRGLEILSVVEHVDEAHPHIHCLSVPLRTQTNPRMSAKVTHPGHAAAARRKARAHARFEGRTPVEPIAAEDEPTERKRTRGRRGVDIGRRNIRDTKSPRKRRRKAGEPATLEQIVTQLGQRAFKAAMREWQSELYRSHSCNHGLARVGPGLERLSRRAWWQRQKQSEELAFVREGIALAQKSAERFVDQVSTASAAARAAEERKQKAETDVAVAEQRVEELKAEEAAAHETIRRAENLRPISQSLEGEIADAQQRLADLSADVALAERKIADANEAEAKRAMAEAATADAERRWAQAEERLTLLREREDLAEKRNAQLDRRDRENTVRRRGLAAWASGRLGLDAEGRLAILVAKEGRDPKKELEALAPVEPWLVDAVTHLESMFTKRLARAADQVKRTVVATVRAWANGLIYHSKGVQSGVAVRSQIYPDASEKFVAETFGNGDVVQHVLPLLPDLSVVHDVQQRAERADAMLTAAEQRQLNNAFGAMKGLGGRLPRGR